MGFRVFLLCFLFIAMCSKAWADCRGVVKVVGSTNEEKNVVLDLQVFASNKAQARVVHYMIFGEVRIRTPFNTTMMSSISHSGMTRIESGDEDLEERAEVAPLGGFPISKTTIKSIIVTGCYLQ